MATRRSSHHENLNTQNVATATISRNIDEKKEIPFWDKKKRTLVFTRKIVKIYRTSARNQIKIIERFSEQLWIDWIANPLSKRNNEASRKQLYQTLKRLNRKQKQANIHFRCDGTGRGIIWETV
jgi:hypothetical protein